MESGEIKATIKPDIDNVAKAVLDGLNGIAFEDDKQVINLRIAKAYANEARLEIEVESEKI